MADFSQSSVSEVQTKRPRLEQDEHISSSSASFNVPVSNTQYENGNLLSYSNNLSENCSSSVDDFRPTHQACSSGDQMCSSREEAPALCSSSRPSLSPNIPAQQQDSADPTIGTDDQPSSSSTTEIFNEHHTGTANNEEFDDSDQDLDLNLGNWTPKPAKGPLGWLQQQMIMGINPRSILSKFFPGTSFPEEMDECQLWSLLVEYFEYLSEPKRRQKLETYNTMEDVIHLLQSSTKILVLTGAGVSVSCGIPDFRSRDGIYARLSQDFPDLPDPQSMFDIHYFRRDPRPFFKFAKEIYPGQFKPSVNHQFISVLEQQVKLLRNYTQNIDTLEQVAGITKVIQCHGSFATASCTRCKYKVNADAIRQDIFNQVVPVCSVCPVDSNQLAVMKPDIVFFGEGLPNSFYESLEDDKNQADLLIVIGSSLKVRPVATIPNMLPHNVPQILINREPLPHMTFDIELLGDSDIIVNELCRRLGAGWNHICDTDEKLEESLDMPPSAKILFETMSTPSYSQEECEENSEAVDNATTLEADHPECASNEVFHFSENQSNYNSTLSHENDSFKSHLDEQTNEKNDVATESSSTAIAVSQNSLIEKAPSSSSIDINEKGTNLTEKQVETVVRKKSQRRYSRDSIATHLKPSTFLFLPPNRYIFHGAEVYPDSDHENDSIEINNSSLNTSSSTSNDIENGDTRETHDTKSTVAEDITPSQPDASATAARSELDITGSDMGLVQDHTKTVTVTDITATSSSDPACSRDQDINDSNQVCCPEKCTVGSKNDLLEGRLATKISSEQTVELSAGNSNSITSSQEASTDIVCDIPSQQCL